MGYGDSYPINPVEMFLGTIILLGGVAFFSFIMREIIDIINNYSTSVVDSKEHLNQWVTSLERWLGSNTVPKALHEQIEKDFLYY